MACKTIQMSYLKAVMKNIDDPQNRCIQRQNDNNGQTYYIDQNGNRKYDRLVFIKNIEYYGKDEIGQTTYRMNTEGITEYFRQENGKWIDGPDFYGHTYYEDKEGIRFRIHNQGTLEYLLNKDQETSLYVLPDCTHVFYKQGKYQYRQDIGG